MTELFLIAPAELETALGLFEAARTVARKMQPTRIDILMVRRPPIALIVPTDEVLGPEQFMLLREQEAERAAELRQVFDGWAASGGAAGLDCHWIDVESMPSEEIAHRSDKADLILVGRPSSRSGDAAYQTVRAALFDSHRPVLVIPPGPPAAFGRRIAIAWKDDGRAVKALIPALRYFGGAEDIRVVAGYRDKEPTAVPEPIAARGVDAQLYTLLIGAEPFGQMLLAKLDEIGADLLIMGAYAHSPLHEMLLGGVTRYVLAHAKIPVLMRH
jgi:nucleotide-binding universal stress UspA family protein